MHVSRSHPYFCVGRAISALLESFIVLLLRSTSNPGQLILSPFFFHKDSIADKFYIKMRLLGTLLSKNLNSIKQSFSFCINLPFEHSIPLHEKLFHLRSVKVSVTIWIYEP